MYEYCYNCLHECDNDICRDCAESTVKGAIPSKFEPLQFPRGIVEVEHQTEKVDPVNHPSHYETGKFECIEVMKEVFGEESVKAFCLLNAFKYLYRCKRKNNKTEDIKKANWYINKYLELERE